MPSSYALNYKAIPYTTTWIDFPEIEPLSKELGIPPTFTRVNGAQGYTVPFIVGHSTGLKLAGSGDILSYLSKAYNYADFPAFRGEDLVTKEVQDKFQADFLKALEPLWQFTALAPVGAFSPAGGAHYRWTQELAFGQTLESLTPKGEKKTIEWNKLKASFGAFAAKYKDKKGTLIINADGLSILDAFAGGLLKYASIALGSEQWKEVQEWDSGFWAEWVKALSKYEAVL